MSGRIYVDQQIGFTSNPIRFAKFLGYWIDRLKHIVAWGSRNYGNILDAEEIVMSLLCPLLFKLAHPALSKYEFAMMSPASCVEFAILTFAKILPYFTIERC